MNRTAKYLTIQTKYPLKRLTSHGGGRRFNPYRSHHRQITQIHEIIAQIVNFLILLIVTELSKKHVFFSLLFEKRYERGTNERPRLIFLIQTKREQHEYGTQGRIPKVPLNYQHEYGRTREWQGSTWTMTSNRGQSIGGY